MGLREELQKKIDKKTQETRELEQRIRENNSYLQGLQEAMRMLDKDPAPLARRHVIPEVLRPGSAIAQAQAILKRMGKAMHLDDLLREMGKPVSRNTKASLAGTLSPFVQRGQIFTRPAPNTFGLVEFGETTDASNSEEPPDSFGLDSTRAANGADELL